MTSRARVYWEGLRGRQCLQREFSRPTVVRKFGRAVTHGRAGGCRFQGAVLRAQMRTRIRKVTSKNNNVLLSAGPGIGRNRTGSLVPFARPNGTNHGKCRGARYARPDAIGQVKMRHRMHASKIGDRHAGLRPCAEPVPIFAWVKTPTARCKRSQ